MMYKATIKDTDENQLTEEQKAILRQLEVAVQELHDSLFEEEVENESNIH